MRTRVLLGILNVAVVATGVQFVSARAGDIGPAKSAVDASLSVEADRIVGLRAKPSAAPAPAQGAALAPKALPVAAAPDSLPIAGKGMWIWLFKQVEGGDPDRIVRRAKALGLSHVFVRSSSSTSKLKFLPDIDRILPVAHANGIRVIAWDFPTLKDVRADVKRLATVLDHVGPGGHKVDGIAVDLETRAEGVDLTPQKARYLSRRLAEMRPDRFRLLVPPRPSKHTIASYPYDIIRYYDAVAPMVYWITRPATTLVRQSMAYLRRYGKPIAPVGQAYDPAEDGGPAGPPPGRVLEAFANQAKQSGAVGVSFWSWQHATPDHWRAIRDIRFDVPALATEAASTRGRPAASRRADGAAG